MTTGSEKLGFMVTYWQSIPVENRLNPIKPGSKTLQTKSWTKLVTDYRITKLNNIFIFFIYTFQIVNKWLIFLNIGHVSFTPAFY